MRNSIFKVTILSITYYVKGNTTRCKITWFNPISGNTQTSFGIARCHPNDKFYVELGKRVSESRAKQEVYRDYIIAVNNAAERIVKKHSIFCSEEYNHELSLYND